MERIVITKEMLLAARDYVEIGVKEAWCKENAMKCFDKLAITADDEPVPPMYMVNAGLKARYLMAAFAAFYLRQDFEALESDNALMSVEEYDRWAGSHALNQIERWKQDRELRDKCFDLLSDYKDLEKQFSIHINGLLAAMNDMVIRQNDYMAAQMKELPALLEQIKDMQGKAESHAESESA